MVKNKPSQKKEDMKMVETDKIKIKGSEKNEEKLTVLTSSEERNRGTKDSPVYGLKDKEDFENEI